MFWKVFICLVGVFMSSMVAGFEDCSGTGKAMGDASILRFNVNVEEPCGGQCAEGTWMKAARLSYCMDEKASGEIHALFKKCISSCEEEKSRKVMRQELPMRVRKRASSVIGTKPTGIPAIGYSGVPLLSCPDEVFCPDDEAYPLNCECEVRNVRTKCVQKPNYL